MTYFGSEHRFREEIVTVFLEIVHGFFLYNHSLDSLALHLLNSFGSIFHDLLEHENQTSVRESDIRTSGDKQIRESINRERIISN